MNIRCGPHPKEYVSYLNVDPDAQGKNRLMCSLCYEGFLDKGGQRFQIVNLNQFISNPFALLLQKQERHQWFHSKYVKYLGYTSIDFDELMIGTAKDLKALIDSLNDFLYNYIRGIQDFRDQIYQMDALLRQQLKFTQVIDELRCLSDGPNEYQLKQINQSLHQVLIQFTKSPPKQIKTQFELIQSTLDSNEQIQIAYIQSKQHKIGDHLLRILENVNEKLGISYKSIHLAIQQIDPKSQVLNRLSFLNHLKQDEQMFFENQIMPKIRTSNLKLIYKYDDDHDKNTHLENFSDFFKTSITAITFSMIILRSKQQQQTLGIFSMNLKLEKQLEQSYDEKNTFIFSITKKEVYQFTGKRNNTNFKILDGSAAIQDLVYDAGIKGITFFNGSPINVYSKELHPQFSIQKTQYHNATNLKHYLLNSPHDQISQLEIYA